MGKFIPFYIYLHLLTYLQLFIANIKIYFSSNFDVKTHSQDIATEIGYTSADLQLHTDYVFTYHQPMVCKYLVFIHFFHS